MILKGKVDAETLVAILMNDTRAVGETNTDKDRNEKLSEVADVTVRLVDELLWISDSNKDDSRASVKQSADISKAALLEVKEHLEDLNEVEE